MSQVSAEQNPNTAKKSKSRKRRKKSGKTSEVVATDQPDMSDLLSSDFPMSPDQAEPINLTDLMRLTDEQEPADERKDPINDPMIEQLLEQLRAFGEATCQPATNGPANISDAQQVSPIHQLVGAMSLDLVECRQFEEEFERTSRQDQNIFEVYRLRKISFK